MLLAKNEEGILLNAMEKQPSLGDQLFCPACSGEVRFKNGRVMRPHFAHISLENCSSYAENESAEHLNLKAGLYSWGKQIADLLIDDRIALEIQCSPLSQERLEERTLSYRQHGYPVLWLLGKKLWLKQSLTKLQKDFLYFSQNMGFHLWELDEKKQELRLKYLIHEDLHGRAQYKVKSFPFGQDCLLSVLRRPFQKQELESYLARQDPEICRYVRQQLYYQQPRWMKLQAQLYQKGDNLLTKSVEDFYPQVRPVQASSFCQITRDLTPYYQYFNRYYQAENNKQLQIIYPPVFYARRRADS